MKKNMNGRNIEDLTFEGPATYRIRIRGALEEHWSDYLGGMSITTSRQGDHVLITDLSGRLVDQAALVGVLNTIYDMHLPIVSLTVLEQDPGA